MASSSYVIYNFGASIAGDIHILTTHPLVNGWCNFSAFLLWRWNEAKQKKVVKLDIAFTLLRWYSQQKRHRSRETFFYLVDNVNAALYKLKGGWPLWYFLRKMDFFPSRLPWDSRSTIFLFPRDEPKTWKLPWVMRYSAAAGHKTYSQWGKICMANVFSNWDRLSVSDKYVLCWGCLKAWITICK